MDQKTLIIIIVLIFIFLFIMLISALLVARSSKEEIVYKKKRSKIKKDIKTDIKDMINIVKNRDTDRNDLAKAVIKVAKECKFPEKKSEVLTKEAKTYLTFVLLLCSHKNADAKLIAFANEELKKTNPQYIKEIDIYENEGIKERGNRV